MAKIKPIAKADLYRELNAKSFDSRDCAVIAIAAVTGLSYEAAHTLARAHGRKNRGGMRNAQIIAALAAAGKTVVELSPLNFIKKYPRSHQILKSVTTHHPDRFPDAWKDGNTYLVFTRGHVLAVVNGVNCDWTRGRAKRVCWIYRVVDAHAKKDVASGKDSGIICDSAQ